MLAGTNYLICPTKSRLKRVKTINEISSLSNLALKNKRVVYSFLFIKSSIFDLSLVLLYFLRHILKAAEHQKFLKYWIKWMDGFNQCSKLRLFRPDEAVLFYLNPLKSITGGVLWKKRLWKFHSIHRKTPVLESLFNKVAGLWSFTFIMRHTSITPKIIRNPRWTEVGLHLY